MTAIRKPPDSRQKWLESFSRRLAWSFPESQAKEILADYQQQFNEGRSRQKSDAEIINALGAPREAIAQLLEEDPAAKTEQFHYTLLWSAAAAVCCAFIWLCLQGSIIQMAGVCLFLPISASALFMLLRGPARITLERLLPPLKTASRTFTFLLPAAAMLACTALQEIVIIAVLRLHVTLTENIGYPITLFLLLFGAASLLLAAWFLLLCSARSIRYFPGAVHALGGAAGSSLFMLEYYTSMDVDLTVPPELVILSCLLPYFAGLITALAFQRWIDGQKPLPLCFQAKAAAWPDWRHYLGVNLLNWYDPGPAAEIIADYQEQYELGRERGRSEDDILSEFGRPAAVVRALLAEDRKARRRSRKIWLWGVPLLAGVWFLARLVLSYDGVYGYVASRWIEGCLFLVLGAASLFMLFHCRGRAILERQFPADKKPTVWVFLMPLVCTAAVTGWMVFSLIHSTMEINGRAVPWILADLIEFSTLVTLLLLLWTLARCNSGSIMYFPAAVHSAGSMAGILTMGSLFRHMDIANLLQAMENPFSGNVLQIILPFPYLLGVLLAAVFWAILRAAGKWR